MGHNDHIDFDLYEAIQDLLDEGSIEEASPAYGVAQQVIHNGEDSLSPKQQALYRNAVVPALTKRGEELRFLHISLSNPE
jgi:hypothetical protein